MRGTTSAFPFFTSRHGLNAENSVHKLGHKGWVGSSRWVAHGEGWPFREKGKRPAPSAPCLPANNLPQANDSGCLAMRCY